MPRKEEERGAVAWVRRQWRALLAETIATALLVWLGIAAMMPVRGDATVQLTHPAMAFGFIVVGNAIAFGPVSGAHMSPAVTLAAVLHGRLAADVAAAYLVAQTLGAVLGFSALQAVEPGATAGEDTGCTVPAPGVSAPSAAALEAALTGVLVLACCGVWAAHDAARPDPSAPIKLGLVVAGLVYAGGHATGTSLNPARSFAPAFLKGYWKDHWVYWVGPLGGAAVAALLHRWVLTPQTPTRRRAVDMPLAMKP